MSKSDKQPPDKSQRLMTFAILNAFGQYLVTWVVVTFDFLSAFGGSSSTPSMISNSSPIFHFVSDNWSFFINITLILSLAFVPARLSRKRRWHVVAFVAMVLNAGAMLLLTSTVAEGFALPMFGYMLSAWLIVEHNN